MRKRYRQSEGAVGGSRGRPVARMAVGLLAGGTLLLSAGCGKESHDDLQAWVTQVKGSKSGRVEPLPEFKSYETHSYSVHELRDPFTPDAGEAEMEQSEGANGIQPDASRRREALEAFPLDSLNYVGELSRAGERWAIVTSPDGLVHRVQTGNYIGQNHGKIHTITEARLEITEIIPDGMGGWIEREASLALSE